MDRLYFKSLGSLVLFVAVAISIVSCGRSPLRSELVSRMKPPRPEPAREREEREVERGFAEFFLRKRVIPGTKEYPIERLASAREHVQRMPFYPVGGRVYETAAAGNRDLNGNAWTPLGPGNIGGRTRNLVIHPTNFSTMYAGGVSGGVWRTDDGGQNWRPIADLLANVNIGALVIDSVNPNILYAGTGEFYQGLQGLGIYKTTDGGATWAPLAATQSKDFYYVNRMVISPANHNRVYAATASGVWGSTDGGVTWKQLLPQSQAIEGCQDLVIRQDQSSDYLFASCTGTDFNQPNAIWRNQAAAAGGNWQVVQSVQGMARTSLAIAPSQPSTIYAMAASDGTDNAKFVNGLLAVFRSTSSGDPGSWETRTSNRSTNPLNASLLSYPEDVASTFCTGSPAASITSQGDYDNILAVSPNDPNVVWAGGIHLFRSDDGGANWGFAERDDVHVDEHIIVFHPQYDGKNNQTIYVGNDGGIWRTDNALAVTAAGPNGACYPSRDRMSKVRWRALNSSYAVTQFYFGTPYPGGGIYFGGTQDNGTIRGTDAAAVNGWQPVYGGDGGAVAFDPQDANTIYFESETLDLNKSTDGGATFKPAISGILEDPASFPFIAFLAMDPNEGRRLFLGGNQFLWRSVDGAGSWKEAAPQPVNGEFVSAITISPYDSNTVLFANSAGYIYRSSSALATDGSSQWLSARPRAGYVSRITFDPSNPAVLYATYSSYKLRSTDQHIYRSTDGGATWTGIDGSGASSIPDIPVHIVLPDPKNPQLLYAGTELGLFVSPDGGLTWGRDPNPFANAITESLVIDRNAGGNTLFAFTYGRSAWKTPLPGAVTGCQFGVSPTMISAPSFGGVFAVNVQTNPGCGWAGTPSADYGSFATLQAPGFGNGTGSAYVNVPPNFDVARSETVNIAGVTVTVNQSANAGTPGRDEYVGITSTGTLPFGGAIGSVLALTSATTDPIHSCTSSRDFHSGWWRVVAPSSGTMTVAAASARLDIYGNAGFTLTAYPAATPAAASELGCFTMPRDQNDPRIGQIHFSVTAGSTYLIEMSASDNQPSDAFAGIQVAMTAAPTAVTVSPASVKVAAGATQQFSASVANAANPSVRWSVSPAIGVISPAGVYTPPAQVAAPTQVTVTATSFFDPTKSASAVVSVTSPVAAISAQGTTNAASLLAGAVAPGEIVTLFGSALGPAQIQTAQLTADGTGITKSLAGTQVLFDGVPAPMIYTLAGQVSAIVPYAVAGKSSTQVQVTYNGQTTNSVTIPVAASAPALFTAASSGFGQAAALNQDNSFNSASRPAARGSVVQLFGTGEGLTTPAGGDGKLATPPYPTPNLPVSVTIGGKPAPILYKGSAPGLVQGLLQLNVQIPTTVTPGNSVPVVVTIGNTSSRDGVTLAIQ